ncbi:MAG: glycosyltransferase family 2 protein [Deltaproteobacteria bacterium]|nr:glycosyltransferase family 2 protein [Deltaproteobacteria bacterium]
MRPAAIVPAYQAAPVVGGVVTELLEVWPEREGVLLIDDGSTDETADRAEHAGAQVIAHDRNRGKGAALRTGMRAAFERGFDVAVTLDADAQHPPVEALRMHQSCPDPAALVLGIRDLAAAGAPRANQRSNAFSNLVLSGFTGRWLRDTQCGLRRYPLGATLALGGQEDGYGYEAEILIRAIIADMPIVQTPITVIYPPEGERISHFDSVRDPARIVVRVLRTVTATRARWLLRRIGGGGRGAGSTHRSTPSGTEP